LGASRYLCVDLMVSHFPSILLWYLVFFSLFEALSSSSPSGVPYPVCLIPLFAFNHAAVRNLSTFQQLNAIYLIVSFVSVLFQSQRAISARRLPRVVLFVFYQPTSSWSSQTATYSRFDQCRLVPFRHIALRWARALALVRVRVSVVLTAASPLRLRVMVLRTCGISFSSLHTSCASSCFLRCMLTRMLPYLRIF
jgi:hypothetical protein